MPRFPTVVLLRLWVGPHCERVVAAASSTEHPTIRASASVRAALVCRSLHGLVTQPGETCGAGSHPGMVFDTNRQVWGPVGTSDGDAGSYDEIEYGVLRKASSQTFLERLFPRFIVTVAVCREKLTSTRSTPSSFSRIARTRATQPTGQVIPSTVST